MLKDVKNFKRKEIYWRPLALIAVIECNWADLIWGLAQRG